MKPEISYESNALTAEQKKHYTRALVLSQDGMWYLFENEIEAGTRIMSPRDLFKSWEDFSLRVKGERLELLYFQCFDKKPSKKLLENTLELSVQVWMRLCDTAVSRLAEKAAAGSRTSKLADRKYEVVKFEVDHSIKLPPQARTCMLFFKECAAAVQHDDATGIFSISEKKFNEFVVANAERLHTRQDPWRIFQYYRPQLINLGFIRLV